MTSLSVMQVIGSVVYVATIGSLLSMRCNEWLRRREFRFSLRHAFLIAAPCASIVLAPTWARLSLIELGALVAATGVIVTVFARPLILNLEF